MSRVSLKLSQGITVPSYPATSEPDLKQNDASGFLEQKDSRKLLNYTLYDPPLVSPFSGWLFS